MAEIHAILRAADPIVGRGGRALLTKVLRGSRSSDVVRHGLDENPFHGYYRNLPEADVIAKIDSMIVQRYLHIVYEGRLPVLAYTSTGWMIERENYADELFRGFDDLLASGKRPYAMGYLKDRDRTMIMMVLDKVQASGDPKYLPLLEDWAHLDYQKIRQRIRQVSACLAGS